MTTPVFTPRPIPKRRLPALGGAGVVAVALPIFVLAGWPLDGWALGAILWAGSQLLEFLFARVGIRGEPSIRGSGLVAFGMMGRGILVMLIAFAVAASDPALALAAALVYAAAYTVELVFFLAAYGSAGDPR